MHEALIDLCECGLITCTTGTPGSPDATYALGWIPLDQADHFPKDVRERHAENMRRVIGYLRKSRVLSND